ncbi:MAG: hypothetical protein Q8R16_04300 [bacterium]|nr:hypothetical protein [bacterium]
MDTKEKPKDPHDPREYRPVPKGGYKIFVMVSTIQVVTAVLGWWLIVPIFSRPVGTHVIPNALLFVLWAVVSVRFFVKEILPALDEYVLRTARGYRLACWLGHPLAGKQLLYRVIAPGTPVGDVAQPTLILPLGGWFRRPTIVIPKGQQSPWPFIGREQVRVKDIALTGPDGTAVAIAGSAIRLTDNHGNCMTLTVWQVLDVLEQHGVSVLTGLTQSLMNVLGELSKRTEHLTRERDAAQLEVQRLTEEATSQRNGAMLGFAEAIITIESSSRLKDTLEGLLLLQKLLTRIVAVCQQDSSKEHWRDRLTVVEARIAEKQKRDRRRHGKPAATPAT